MRKTKSLAAIALSMAMLLTMVPVVPAKAAVKVSKVAVASATSGSTKKVVVAKGKSVKLTTTVTVKPNKSANKKVSYKSANSKIASVSSKGVVKGKKAGSTKITVTSKKDSKKKAAIKVTVKKGAVTSVALDQTTGTINVGDTVALKATVKAKKGADKTIAWKSSSDAVATVSSKGVVTAVAPGSVVITAQAIDGSGKKATYTVTVLQPVNLASMEVQNAQSLVFALDNPCALDMSQVEVKIRQNATGTFNRKLTVDTLTSADSVNYSLVINSKTRINVGDYVQVSVPSLTGTAKTIEKQYMDQICAFTEDSVVSWKVNEYGTRSYSFDERGYGALQIIGLPAGLTAEEKNGSLIVKGIPTATGVTNATLTAVDEIGNTLTQTVKFVVYKNSVYDNDGNITEQGVLVGAATEKYALAATTDTNNLSFSFNSIYGGSSNYYYSVINDAATGLEVSNSKVTGSDGKDLKLDGYICYNNSTYYSGSGLYSYAKITAPGTYDIVIRAYDKKDVDNYISDSKKYPVNTIKKCDVTVRVNVAQGVTVAGIVKDAAGNPIPNADLTFTNKNRADKYTTSRWAYSSSSTTGVGAYSVVLSPGTYDIEASYSAGISDSSEATNYLYSQALTETKSGFDIALNLYKVSLVGSKTQVIGQDGNEDDVTMKDVVESLSWKSNHESVGSGDTLYLKAGTYTLEAEEIIRTTDYTKSPSTTTYSKAYYTATVTITNAAVQVSVEKPRMEALKSSSSNVDRYLYIY
ncbi:MAG: Ig-like domain-containing protein [Lachnospiraceae bacterium]|nr:Ig-like domain-containing protein [Lachnospiraceae bacterium]